MTVLAINKDIKNVVGELSSAFTQLPVTARVTVVPRGSTAYTTIDMNTIRYVPRMLAGRNDIEVVAASSDIATPVKYVVLTPNYRISVLKQPE